MLLCVNESTADGNIANNAKKNSNIRYDMVGLVAVVVVQVQHNDGDRCLFIISFFLSLSSMPLPSFLPFFL